MSDTPIARMIALIPGVGIPVTIGQVADEATGSGEDRYPTMRRRIR